MYHGKTVSLVFPAFNEAENIANAVLEFRRTNLLDEIIVVDNNSRDKTANLAKKNGAKVIKEPRQGYGFAVIKGLRSANGEYVVLAEPDGTFSAQDLKQLLRVARRYDCVLGTRTNQAYIQAGANMNFLLRWGNILIAKILQVLFNTPSISDCGCTYRVFKRKVINVIAPQLTVGSSHLLPQTVILTQLAGFSITEIPIKYQTRIGTSKITGSLSRAIKVGFNMLGLILDHYRRRQTAYSPASFT